MKVDISTREKKAFLCGTQYVVSAKVELTPEELAVHRKHLAGGSLFGEDIKNRVGEDGWFTILKRRAYIHGNYLGKGMEVKFLDLSAATNFENVLLEGFERWKRQIENHQTASQTLGKSRTLEF